MKLCPIRLVKVGGSLFDLPDLPDRLRGWLAAQSPAQNVLVAGGGPMVDLLRRFDRQQPMGDANCHWLAIDLMDVMARLLGAWLPEAPVVRVGRDVESWELHKSIVIVEPGAFLREIESSEPGLQLPQDWTVTSDSIAAATAVVVNAAELVLLKSASPPMDSDHGVSTWMAAQGYVDPFFPDLAEKIPAIRYVNLRDWEDNMAESTPAAGETGP